MKLNFFTGTAAELIKLYPLIHLALKQGHDVRVISSGQSRENFLMQYRDLQLDESHLVQLMDEAQDLKQASSALRWFFKAMLTPRRKFRSKILAGGYLIVHGDTLSTLVGAWLGWRSNLPVVHIEAGLRSSSIFNPFPEEITRRWVSRFSKYHMAPDHVAADNLRRAHVTGQITLTDGNTLLDAVTLSARMQLGKVPSSRFALVNVHRFENLNSNTRWEAILNTAIKAAEKVHVIFVAHPQTRHKLDLDGSALERFNKAGIEIRDRMPFTEFISLLKAADFLISDGGSNQEECSYLGKPCLLLREATERKEGLDSCCVLSRFDVNVIDRFLAHPEKYSTRELHQHNSPSQAILKSLTNA